MAGNHKGCPYENDWKNMDMPKKPQRKSIRLKEYNYSQPGAYFVTIVTQGRICRFGEIKNGEMILNAAGEMAREQWLALPKRFPMIELGSFVIMPNHGHGNIVINDERRGGACPRLMAGAQTKLATTRVAPMRNENAPTLGDIVGAFKSITTVEYIRGVKELGWSRFEKRLWQRNYYEHIIRDQKDWERIHLYIEANPSRWDDDEENPLNIP